MLMQDIRAIVTGGASGLGLAVVEDVIAAGGRATLLDVNEAAGHETVQRLGERSAFQKVDVTSESAVDAAVRRPVAMWASAWASLATPPVPSPLAEKS